MEQKKNFWKLLAFLPIIAVAIVVIVILIPKQEPELKVSAKDIQVTVQESVQIDYTVSNSKSTCKFIVTNNNIASVSNNMLTGLQVGETELTIEAKYGSQSATCKCKVTVVASEQNNGGETPGSGNEPSDNTGADSGEENNTDNPSQETPTDTPSGGNTETPEEGAEGENPSEGENPEGGENSGVTEPGSGNEENQEPSISYGLTNFVIDESESTITIIDDETIQIDGLEGLLTFTTDVDVQITLTCLDETSLAETSDVTFENLGGNMIYITCTTSGNYILKIEQAGTTEYLHLIVA